MKIQSLLFETAGGDTQQYSVPFYVMDHQSEVVITKRQTKAGETVEVSFRFVAPKEALTLYVNTPTGPFLERWLKQATALVNTELDRETWPAKTSARVSISCKGDQTEVSDSFGSWTTEFPTRVFMRLFKEKLNQSPLFAQVGWRLERVESNTHFTFGYVAGRERT